MISKPQRDVLIDHLDGNPVPILRPNEAASNVEASDRAARQQTTIALLSRGLLKTDNRITPRTTLITDAGRAEISAALADWADALVRARWDDPRLMASVDKRPELVERAS